MRGSDFERYTQNSQNKYIISERLLQIMNLDNPIGQQLTLWSQPGEIVEIMKDFHMKSLHDLIEPTLLRLNFSGELAYIRLSKGQV